MLHNHNSWSFITEPLANQGQSVVATSNVVTNLTGLDLSNGYSTEAAGNVLIDAVSQALNNVTSGDLVNTDLSLTHTVGDIGVNVNHAVTLNSTGPISMTNASLPSVTVEMPNPTTIFGPSCWDGVLNMKTGTNSGTAPSGFNIGGVIVNIGSDCGPLLLDKPAVITFANTTGSMTYKPATSSTWVTIGTCGGTYAAPTLAAPTPFGECAISNGTDTKIVTYHFTLFAPLVPVGATTTTMTGAGGPFGRTACSGETCLGAGEANRNALISEEEVVAAAVENILECNRNESTSVPFTDISNHWGKGFIENQYRKCIVDGRSRLLFVPNDNITRAELTKTVLNAFALSTENYKSDSFTDVGAGDWFSKYVWQAASLGIVKGYKVDQFTTVFRPNASITRAEAISVILRAKGINIEAGKYNSDFEDVSKDAWYYPQVSYATEKKIVSGKVMSFEGTGNVRDLYDLPEKLQIGSSGDSVKALEEILMRLDYFRGAIDGVFDQELANAVIAYQKNNGIAATGNVFEVTRSTLEEEYLTPKTIKLFYPEKPMSRAEVLKVLSLVEAL